MRAQLIVDCGGRTVSALLVTADGQLVPCSQEIRQIAARHVSADVLFEPRVVEDRDFLWEDAVETLAKANARNFFTRARRIGLRRPWDPQASAEALQLASPLTVLSSPAALADRVVGTALPAVGMALLDALLDPTFAFVAERQLVPADLDVFIVLPAQTGRHARLILQKLFRRRGFRHLTVVRREIAAAMVLTDHGPCDCTVIETADNDLHLHRVAIEGSPDERRFRTISSRTIPGFGWSYWVARIAEALRTSPSAGLERSLTALLTGSPESLPPRISHAALESVLAETWIAARSREVASHLILGEREQPLLFAGEIFTLPAVRSIFGTPAVDTPVLDAAVRGVALAMRQARVTVAPYGALRVNTFHGEAVELLSHAQLPAPGEACHVATDFRLGGEGAAGRSFLVQLLWGGDRVPAGNAPLCAMALELRGQNELRLTVHLRRSRGGRRLHGIVEARMPRDVVAARARFSEDLEVMR